MSAPGHWSAPVHSLEPVGGTIVDVVTERDVVRDENLVTEARLKVDERALELLAVKVGQEQGAQGALPELVVNGELRVQWQRRSPVVLTPHDDIQVEIEAQANGMLSKLELGLELGLGLG